MYTIEFLKAYNLILKELETLLAKAKKNVDEPQFDKYMHALEALEEVRQIIKNK